jgi:hypothetical protein
MHRAWQATLAPTSLASSVTAAIKISSRGLSPEWDSPTARPLFLDVDDDVRLTQIFGETLRHASVSTPRSSNRTCGFAASGSRRRLTQSPRPSHVTPSATLKTTWEFSGLSPISLSIVASCVRLQPRSFPPPELPGFVGTLSLSAIPNGPHGAPDKATYQAQ